MAALADEISKWLKSLPESEPIGVCFSGGIDSGSVFLVAVIARVERLSAARAHERRQAAA